MFLYLLVYNIGYVGALFLYLLVTCFTINFLVTLSDFLVVLVALYLYRTARKYVLCACIK